MRPLLVLGDVIVGGVSDALHDSLEAELRVSGVLDDPLGAVGLVQGVHSLDGVAVAVLPGLLVVTGVEVLYSVFEFVWNGSLGREREVIKWSVKFISLEDPLLILHSVHGDPRILHRSCFRRCSG